MICKFNRLPNWRFFLAKFFGSGVIVATAFIHLLQPANEALSNECLGGTFEEYPWAFGICLMSLFLLFLVEIISHYLTETTFYQNETKVVDDDEKKLEDDSDSEDLADNKNKCDDNSKLKHVDPKNTPEQQFKKKKFLSMSLFQEKVIMIIK